VENKVQVQRFLGCLTYADPFIKKLAEMRKPLQVKIKDKILRHWDDKDSEYIAKIKKQLISLPKLYLPAKDDFIILETDASDEYWSAILKARLTDGTERLCKYSSGTFKDAEKNYHSNEKEYLAVKNGIKKFEIYLAPKQFW
jgi:hypothetical protein